jgi:hypothetical protein
MKNSDFWLDLISTSVGIGGAFIKALKLKLPRRTTILSMLVGGVIAYGGIAILSLFFKDLSPKILVLASFSFGWVANELTTKLDSFVNDFYDILIVKIKSILKIK